MLFDTDNLKITHIHDIIVLAKSFVAGRSYEQFRDDTLCFYAVVRALEIVSEASRKLSAELKARHPQVPWRDIAGAGSIYRHDYEDVIQQRVWHTVQEALPMLIAVVDAELPVERRP